MEKLFRYLRGYLKIRVWGYSPERFMNLCGSHHILLWDIARQEDGYVMYITISGFFRLRPFLKKTGTRAAVLERYGLPFFVRRMRKRKVFALGLPCCLAFLIVMSRFVWAIDFEGNRALTDDILLDYLAQCGVDYGVAKNEVDIGRIEALLRERFSEITWASVQMEGTRLVVKIRENSAPAQEEGDEWLQEQPGSDLIAARDGVICSILTRKGVPQVTEGMQVKQGDLLVSGAVPVLADDGTVKEYQYCHADADIIAVYQIPVHEEQELCYEYKNYTGRVKRDFYLALGQKKWLLTLGKCRYLNYDSVLDTRQLRILPQVYLPLSYGFLENREYLPVEAVYEEEAAKKILEERLEKNIAGLEEKGVQIIQKDVTISAADGVAVLDGVLQVAGPIGSLRPLEEKQPVPENETVGSS